MDTVLRDVFINLCIDHYLNVIKVQSSNNKQEYYGVPPKSIVIVVGTSRRKEWFPITKREAVFRYDKHNLQEVAVDTAPDRTEQGMYFKEAYAELCLQENGTAFMMIQLGKRYARCYRYLIINDNGSIQFTDETLMWIS